MQNGGYMQQDADECLRGLLQTLTTTLKTSGPEGNRIDELFGFKLKSTMKCLECDEEPTTTQEEMQRVLLCHLGTQTDPVSHIYQGVSLSLKEHIEKQSPALGRNAQYEKTSALASLPPFLIVQFARFGFKGANEWAGTSASKVKLIRNIKFSPTFDLHDCSTLDIQKSMTAGRFKKKDQEDKATEAERLKFITDEKKKMAEIDARTKDPSSSSAPGDVEMKDAEDAEMKPTVATEEVDTGYYELVGIVSHKGRTADGGHYVGWTLMQKADPKAPDGYKDDQWVCYDDETVTQWNWKDITGIAMDLMGGRADTQIAYINIYKKVTVTLELDGEKLGDGKETAAGYAAGSASGSAA